MRIPVLTLGLTGVLLLTQAGLWLGDGGVLQVRKMRGQLQAAQAQNDKARRANEQLQSEVQDLRQGLEIVEERARTDLGLIRRDELFVQYAALGPRREGSPAAGSLPSPATATPSAAASPGSR